MPHAIYIIFVFALGACIGSFLNVVVWRLPRVELPLEAGPIRDFWASFKALSNPPSHCPNCSKLLKWYDNLPIVGWIKLRGRCRFCKEPFSIRYPIVELVTALLFVGYYIAFYMLQVRTCCPDPQIVGSFYDAMGFRHDMTNPQWILSESWPIYFLYMALISGLLAASLIDAELYIIPIQIPWVLAIIGFIVHSIADRPTIPGSLNLVGSIGSSQAALSAGAAIGLAISISLWVLKILPTSFANGEPMLEVDRRQIQEEMEAAKRAGKTWEEGPLPPPYTPGQIRGEISKEMLFLLPPLVLGGACLAANVWMPSFRSGWQHIVLSNNWLNALLGSFLGAMVGAFVVWITRILGTLAFRRVAMGLGDVHLMFGVGAIIGAAGATIAFFIAPFFGILTAVYMMVTRRGREIPLGPYLSSATAIVMLFYCWISSHFQLQASFEGIVEMLSELVHHTPR